AETDALREGLHQERLVMEVVGRGNRAARREQRERIRLHLIARTRQRLPFERLLVRLVQQHRELGTKRLRQAMRLELLDPGARELGFALLALERRQRGLEGVGGRAPVPALAT